MNVTKDVINDLYPLYLERECSADTHVLVEEYLQQNPRQAEELRRVQSTPIPRAVPVAKDLDESRSLREARRHVRVRSTVMALAIFFSLAPFSFLHTGGRSYWLFLESPQSAAVYGAVAVVGWIIYAALRRQHRCL